MPCHPAGFLLPARLKTMGDVIYGHDFKRANQKADRAFWLGPESQAKIDAILAEVRAEQSKVIQPSDDRA
jgi:hypothetical protein